METKSTNHRRSKQEMISLIEAWKISSLPQHVFCKEHQVPYNIFQYWYRKFKKENNKEVSDFVEMKIKSGKTFSANCEIIFPSGARLVFSSGTDPIFIRSLVF